VRSRLARARAALQMALCNQAGERGLQRAAAAANPENAIPEVKHT
jgi:hypothetical protein